MTTSEAGRHGRWPSRAQLAGAVVALVVLAVVLILSGGGRAPPTVASGNAGFGRFHPPPVPTRVSAPVRRACAVSSPTLDRIRKDGVLFWAIGVSPPFGFEIRGGVWAGVEAQNAAE